MDETARVNGSPVSRRQFLSHAGRYALGGTAVGGLSAVLRGSVAPQAVAQSRPSDESVVVQVRSDAVFSGELVRPDILGQMLATALWRLTGRERIGDAWHAILRTDDIIGIKFNAVGAADLGTTPIFARTLARSLIEAGWKAKDIVLIEGPDPVAAQLGTTPAPPTWTTEEIDFGSGRDQFAGVLKRITALINVPFLKTHNIAGMTGCLKNLSHALVRRPGRYHGNRCSPYVADIVAAPPIRPKLRLHIVNALRAVFDRGPEVRPTCVWPAATILAAFDPVAADTVGLEILNRQRQLQNLPPLGDDDRPVPYLYAAQRRGLGTATWDHIRVIKIRA